MISGYLNVNAYVISSNPSIPFRPQAAGLSHPSTPTPFASSKRSITRRGSGLNKHETLNKHQISNKHEMELMKMHWLSVRSMPNRGRMVQTVDIAAHRRIFLLWKCAKHLRYARSAFCFGGRGDARDGAHRFILWKEPWKRGCCWSNFPKRET